MELEAKLYMIFDILGDMERTGPLLWKVDRKRTEDIKDHVFDLIIITKLLRDKFPKCVDFEKLENYIICHDLEETITGDITAFEGVPHSEKDRVNRIAMNYLIERFNDVLDFNTYFNNFEDRKDIESHIAYMLDKVQSVIPFLKYDSEELIDMDNEEVLESLRCHPFVIERKKLGKTVSDIFFEYHMQSVKITDDDCLRCRISNEDARQIIKVITDFMNEIYKQSKNLDTIKADFPKEAQLYNKNIA